MMGTVPVFHANTIQPTLGQRRSHLRRLQSLARELGISTEQLYSAMENITLWGSDTQERFGNKTSLSIQVRMLYDEATGRLGAEDGYLLADMAIRMADKE